jgi:hypothetical protein
MKTSPQNSPEIKATKLRLTDSLLGQEKLKKDDLALLFPLLTAKQKKVLALAGLANMWQAAGGDPKHLMDGIKKLAEGLRK